MNEITNNFGCSPNNGLIACLVRGVTGKWPLRLAASLLFLGCSMGQASELTHPTHQYPVKVLPSADLTYAVSVKLYGLPISGTAVTNWYSDGKRYSLKTETRSSIFGKVVEGRSEGGIDAFGLAPTEMTEQRFKKSPYSARFDRQNNILSFTATNQTYPLLGGEQDRNSVMFQLAAVVRGTSGEVAKGAEWTFFVAGRRDAQPWTFRAIGMEDFETKMGVVSALHLKRLQPKNARKQQIELWLAPALEGYPVRVVFKEKRQRIEQVLEKIEIRKVSSDKGDQ